MLTTRLWPAVLLISASACTRQSSPTSAPASVGTATRASDLLTREELSHPSVIAGDALEAVRRLRPRFLASRGATSIRVAGAGSVHVSLDGGPLLSVNVLSRMRPGEIAEIRYLNATEAAQRFGTAAGSGGVMLVKSR